MEFLYQNAWEKHILDDYQLSPLLRPKQQTVSREELIQIFKKSIKLFLGIKSYKFLNFQNNFFL